MRAEKRYEMPVRHLVVYANVRKEKNTLYTDYVFAPEELRGKGVAGEFMRQLMDVVRAEELQAVPVCGLPKTCCNNSALEAQSARNSSYASTNLQ
jgi:predicted GNAT family acetyltransferase